MREKHNDIEFGSRFLTAKSQTTKNREIGLHQNLKLISIKEYGQQNEKSIQNTGKYFQIIDLDKGLILRIYFEKSLQVNNKNNLILKMGKGLNRHFFKKATQIANKHKNLLNITNH